MKTTSATRQVLLLLTALLLVACEPVGPIAGKQLSGPVVAVPQSWDPLNEVEVVQLETGDAYSVNLWGVGLGAYYYVASAQGDDSSWSRHVERDPNVRLRVEGNVYELKAVVVTDPAEGELVKAEFKQKYDLDSDEDFPQAILYRLAQR